MLRSIVRPSAHSGGKSWQKVGTCNFEVFSLPAAFQIPYTVSGVRYLCKISAKMTYLALSILTVDSAKTKLKIAKNFTLWSILFLSSMQLGSNTRQNHVWFIKSYAFLDIKRCKTLIFPLRTMLMAQCTKVKINYISYLVTYLISLDMFRYCNKEYPCMIISNIFCIQT